MASATPVGALSRQFAVTVTPVIEFALVNGLGQFPKVRLIAVAAFTLWCRLLCPVLDVRFTDLAVGRQAVSISCILTCLQQDGFSSRLQFLLAELHALPTAFQ